MEKSRSKNVIRNVKTGLIVQVINKLMAFVVRTVFIQMLNSEYLGVNGLFTNILTILSFAELGIGTAIIFSLYKPVANENVEKIKSLMKLYQKSYNVIGISVFLLGLCVIPFMDILIKEVPNIKENIIFIYILFLINTSISYFFTYKRSIISAYQQESMINKIDSFFYLAKSVAEIILLVLTRNYIVYLIIEILATILGNIVISIKADKMFPYLKEKNVKKIDPKEKKTIFSNVKSLVIYKFGGIIMNGTDNILISSLINVSMVGLCSNYILVINSIRGILSSASNGITASIGNLNAVADKVKKEKIFYQLTFVNFLIYNFCAIAFVILLNPFIKIWLGDDYLLNISIPIALAFSFFIEGLRNPGYTYRVTMGLFEKGKTTPYIGAIANIILSIIFCELWGVVGIFIGTSIAQLMSYSWMDPYIIYKYELKTSVFKYFKKFTVYIIVFIIEAILCLWITSFIRDTGIISFILKGIIVTIVPNIINILLFYRSEEFKALMSKFIYPLIERIKS